MELRYTYAPVHVTPALRPVFYFSPSLSHSLSSLEPTCIVRPEVLFASWTPLEPHRAPPGPTTRSQLPHQICPYLERKTTPHPPTPLPLVLLSAGPTTSYQSSASCQPLKLFKQANHTFLWARGSTRPPVTIKPTSHRPFWFSSLPSAALWGPPCCVATVRVCD